MKKTKETIIDAFWQLLEEKPFNKIAMFLVTGYGINDDTLEFFLCIA